MRVIIGCEKSQEICKRFRALGHEAYSCDILPCSGEHPKWHIHDDVLQTLSNGVCYMQDGRVLRISEWDLMIAHPPCTHTAVSGARYFKEKRVDGRQQKAIDFFMTLVNAPIKKIAIEHPISIMSTKYRKPDQIIQPWMFGYGETKATCLWLKGLPKLKPTNIVEGREARIHRLPPSKDRAELRSKTYPGIAKALAEQYSAFIDSGLTVKEWEEKYKIRKGN